MLRQTPEEDGYLYDLEFVTDPPTPYQYPQSTHEWAIQDAGVPRVHLAPLEERVRSDPQPIPITAGDIGRRRLRTACVVHVRRSDASASPLTRNRRCLTEDLSPCTG
jgi:hypothetical protein